MKGIVEAVPVYQDLVQPAARQVGQALETAARCIHIAMAPISALVWSYDSLKDFLSTRVAAKLQNVPPERIQSPPPNVVGPALEALRYTGHQEPLSELFANLLATSLDADTCEHAHPSFVDIIKNLSPDEARIIRVFASRTIHPVIDVRIHLKDAQGYDVRVRNFSFIGREAECEHPKLTPSYLGNLARLGLIDLPDKAMGVPRLTGDELYAELEADSEIDEIRAEAAHDETRLVIVKGICELTDFGEQFCNACVIDKNAVPTPEP